MKNRIQKVFGLGAIALAMALGSASDAMAFSMQAQVYITPNVVTSVACNPGGLPIVCNVTTVGYLNAGFPIYATETLFLLPGVCENAYVYANYPYYFVNGAASAECVFY